MKILKYKQFLNEELDISDDELTNKEKSWKGFSKSFDHIINSVSRITNGKSKHEFNKESNKLSGITIKCPIDFEDSVSDFVSKYIGETTIKMNSIDFIMNGEESVEKNTYVFKYKLESVKEK